MRKKHVLKRILAVVMIFAIMVSLCPFKSAEVQAKSGKDSQKDWGQKYIDYILNHQFDKYCKNEEPYLYENMTYELIYIDDDDIPEILYSGVDEATGMGVIYINSDGEVAHQYIYRHGFNYIEHEGLVINSTGNTGYYFTDIYSLKNGHFDKIGSGEYTEHFDEDGRFSGGFDYKWEGNIVPEEEYWKRVNGLFNESKRTFINDNLYSLPNNYSDIVLKILAKSLIYSDTPWIKAYQDFLVNKKYLDMGQDYGSEAEIIGKLFDMDHDGIPELILDNGYAGRAVRSGYIYTYDNGVKFLDYGPSEAYVDYEKGYAGTLYGFYTDSYYSGDGFLYAYYKNQNTISNELIKEYRNVTNGFPVYRKMRYVGKDGIFYLLKELETIDSLLKEKVENPVGDFVDLVQLLGGIGWVGGVYDYRSASYESTFHGIFDNHLINDPKKYRGNIIEYDVYDYLEDSVRDPKGRFGGYWRQDGEGTDWILKNIYNASDEQIKKLHNWDDNDLYYYNNDYYYADYGGVGGGYGTYIDKIEDMGGVYHITYHQITYPDGPGKSIYKIKYALVAYKRINGVGYWSLYRVADNLLYDEADLIDLGFQISDKYKPYPIVAFKSTTNGKYITCDIGAKGKDGSYPNMNNPNYNVDATKIGDYEKFYYIILPDGKVALQTYMSKKYVCTTIDGVTVSDFITDNCKFTAYIDGEIYKFKNGIYWLSQENGKLGVSLFDGNASFEKVIIDNNGYSEYEKNILSSGEWFNLEGKGVGYWDIQNEIGIVKDNDNDFNQNSEENVRSLKKLGYNLMFRRDLNNNSNTRTIEYDNMQCSIGVKKVDGIYDVIIAFQGTGGYSDKTEKDAIRDAFSNLTGGITNAKVSINGKTTYVPCHEGYYLMAKKVFDNNPKNYYSRQAIARIGDDEITLYSLIEKASRGEAQFTILGHSMGGAIAQCFAIQLINYGVNPSSIRGRTFNSALALKSDTICDLFTDWYNICVISDSVPRGLVPGSILQYGVHRLGTTVWLYDNEPDQNLDSDTSAHDRFRIEWYELGKGIKREFGKKIDEVSSFVSNIAFKKHNMDWKIKDILLNTTSSAYKGYYSIKDTDAFVTNKYNVPVYDRPKKDADPSFYIEGIHTVVEIESYTYNDVGNKWYRTRGGKFIYSNNLEVIEKQSIRWSILPDFIIASDRAPLRAGCYNDTDVIERLKKDTAIEVEYAVKNGGGNVWYHTTVNGNTGWIYSAHVQRGVSNKRIVDGIKWLLAIDCPVNVSLYTSDDELAASIIDGELFTADEKAINPYVIGNGKYFEIYDDKQYYVEIDSLSDGMMDYTVFSDYDERAGEFKAVKKFEAVDLSEEQYFDSTVGGDISTEDVELRVVDEDGQILSVIGTDGMPLEDAGFFTKKNIIIAGASAAGLVLLTSVIIICRKKRKKSKEKRAA